MNLSPLVLKSLSSVLQHFNIIEEISSPKQHKQQENHKGSTNQIVNVLLILLQTDCYIIKMATVVELHVIF